MDQLQAMKVFVRVVNAGSFGRAADQLGMPLVQPYIDAGALVPVLEEYPHHSTAFHILYAAHRQRTAREKAFVDWALKELKSS